jgi:hypothetical protein
MTFAPVGYRYVALRPLRVNDSTGVEHDLQPGDILPEDIQWRNPEVWVQSGHIAPMMPHNKPGRPAKSVELNFPPLGEAVGAVAGAQTAPELEGDVEPTEQRDFEDLTGGTTPDGYPQFTGEDETLPQPTIVEPDAR